VAGSAEKAAAAYADGEKLLAASDFSGALKAFKNAARADKKNQDYAQQYAMLRQVIRMRERCATEKDTERWLQMAGALRSFYTDHRLYAEALPLDRERFKRSPSSESAAMLAETLVARELDSEAVEMLTALPPKQTSSRTIALHGLALAHLDQLDKAKKVAANLQGVKGEASPAYQYDLARLCSLTSNESGAIKALTSAFEQTPPSRLVSFKTEAMKNPDLANVARTDAFASAMKTQSKVKESDCSKGPGCGKCPKKAKCGKKKP